MLERILCADQSQYFQICIREFLKDVGEVMGPVEVVKVGPKFTLARKLLRGINSVFPFPPLPRIGGGKSNLSITIGPDFAPLMQYCFTARHNYMYMFDCWPQNTDWVVDFARVFRVDIIFFSAKQAADRFNQRKKGSRCLGVWVPEGIDSDSYKFYSQKEKVIDVLEFGRRYDKYHNQIAKPLVVAGKKHEYPDGKRLLFETDDEFVEGLAKSKISICFPSSLTHPERAGDVSTMTLRYLQSMASKCLIVGKLPYDMQYLFDYNPIVEIDEQNPGEQLINILDNFSQYQELVEKNYWEVINRHRWRYRVASMLNSIEAMQK